MSPSHTTTDATAAPTSAGTTPTPQEPPDMTNTDNRYAVIDVEGNGGQPPQIVEIAITPVDGLTIGEPVCWLVKPTEPINPIVTRKVHGIRNADVAHAPAFEQIAENVLAELDGRTPVAHNAQVEHGVLGRHLPTWQPAT